MKRTAALSFLLFAVLSLLLALLVFEPAGSFDKTALRFLCLMPPETEYYWGAVRSGIAEADASFGTYTRIEDYDRYDISSRLRLLSQTDYFHVDGIITIGEPSSPELGAAIASCIDKGIPVALIDTDMPGTDRSFYIGTDNQKAGEAAADKLLELTGGTVHAAVIITGISDANQSERLKGFRRVIDQDPDSDVLVVYENRSDKAALATFLTRTLKSRPSLNAIFCADASTSTTTGVFMKDADISRQLFIIGFDEVAPTPQLVADGVLSGVMIQQGKQMGYEAVRLLIDYKNDPALEPQELYTPAILVEQKDAEAYIS